MSKSVVLVVHGMGKHTAESIQKEVIDAANIALARYDSFKGEKYEDYVEIIGIGYDDIFNKERELIAKNAENLLSILGNTEFSGTGLIEKLAELNDDNFLTTHILDIFFYASLHCEQVRLRVISRIAEALGHAAGRDVHIVAHSMGTAVINDAIHKAYSDGIKNSFQKGSNNPKQDIGTSIVLDTALHRIQSIWMFSNTSQLFFDKNPLDTNVDPRTSMLRPSDSDYGCTLHFFNVSHEYDPISEAVPFEIPAHWNKSKDLSFYAEDIHTEKFYKELNPHSLIEYIINPAVSSTFLAQTLPRNAGFPHLKAEHEKANQKAKEKEISPKFERIKEIATEIKSINDLVDFVKLVDEFKTLIKG